MVKEIVSLQRMQVVSILYLVVLTGGSWLLGSWTFAWSVMAGGLIAILSFWVSQRDLNGFISSLVTNPDQSENEAKARFGKSGFLLRFWFRIVIIGVVVLLLIRFSSVNTFGLILGLSTIVFTVTFTAVEIVRHYYFSGRR